MGLSTHIRQADIIVIGAGVLGTFHAYFAAQKGYKVLLLERNPVPSDASTRNFGMQMQTIVETDSQWAQFTLDSRAIYQTIQQEHDISVEQKGSLYLASTETERIVLKEFAEKFAETYHCIFIEPEEVQRRYPFVQHSYCTGALYSWEDCTLEPLVLVQRVIDYATRATNIEYLPQTQVVEVTSSPQGCLVKDAQGNRFSADQVFVCSGTQYQTLFPEVFSASGLKLCKLQMMSTVPQPQVVLPHSILSGHSIKRYPAFASCPSYRLLEQQEVDAELQKYGIHMLAKQAQDGSVILGDSHEYLAIEDVGRDTYEYTSWHINELLLQYAQNMLSLPDWRIQRMWNGYYMIHPELPVYTHTIDNTIHIVTGIGGKGMSTGPGFSRHNIERILQ
ncbi:TIGR03364 family FAD-dependent oxidoreductase [Dictyobacter kobayashii]|uniref:Oxidase n=1 Tax=Dictyobacter kobayashii TaxID=2014872 RepID=A0A402AW76_9CHLR|nr:TIGR03364 family FAD-dependent oxidoreductase [Dictyobacter kobayashii]GCE23348.1 oxidase [Dictyobacter kobayashii]